MFGLWWIFIGVIILGSVFLGVGFYEYTHFYSGDFYKISFSICIAVAIGILPFCILLPKNAHKEVAKYKYDYEMVQEVILNGTDLENIKITETVLNYNNWLSEAKADKETWGNWSVYYKEDLDSLNPIVIRRNDSKGESNEND